MAKPVKGKSLYGDWRRADLTLKELDRRMDENLAKATKMNAIKLRDAIKKKIKTGDTSWPGISGLTARVKGSTKPLIDHGDLLNSISAIFLTRGSAFIGVPRSVKGMVTGKSEGRVNIAAIHEYGHPGIRPKRGRALAIPANKEALELYHKAGSVRNIKGLFRPKGKMVLMRDGENGLEVMFILVSKVTIPPRPFISTTFKEMEPAMRLRFRQAIADALRGKFYVAR